MNTNRKTPVYNLKVVIRDTGIKPDTIRAWERRYNLPNPARSPGGHRLYSQYDIDVIRWLLDRQEEGLTIGRAVKLWRNFEAQGLDPFVERPVDNMEAQETRRSLVGGIVLEESRELWLEACLNFDEARAEQVLSQSFALHPLEIVCLEVLQKGLAQMGELWYTGKASVQQEHFASSLAIRRLEALVATAPTPTRHEIILIGAPPGEEHVFSLILMTLFLRYHGWPVVYLGANVPAIRLKETIQAVKPDLVVMAAMQLHTASTLLDVAHLVRDQRVPLAFGGLIFNLIPDLIRRIPGVYLGEQLEDVATRIGHIFSYYPPSVSMDPVPDENKKTIEHFLEKKFLIESQVIEVFRSRYDDDLLVETIRSVTHYLSQDILAGLKLGSLKTVQASLDWVRGLMKNHRISAEMLREYLEAYHLAAKNHLDERGLPIINWMASVSMNL